ncbi:MAG: SDR family oxidoreductase [Nitrospira sp.]|nr:SDR family oxidoreductase [Nitrospira sp.]
MSVVWITGAHGFIGRHLASYLRADGATVLGIGHGQWPESEARRWGVQAWVNGAIEPANLDLLVANTDLPSVVYHLAGGSSVGASMRAPLEDFTRTVGTGAQLFDWLRKESPGTAVIVVSSAAVHGAGHDGPISPDGPLRPYSPYGHHKLMLEQLLHGYAENFGLRGVIVRLFSVYGPWLYKQLLWDICSRLAAGAKYLQLGGDGGELRDWTEVEDVSRLLALSANLAGRDVPVINGGTGIATPVRAIAEMIVQAWGRQVPFEFSGVVRPGDPYSLVSTSCCLDGKPFEWSCHVSKGIPRYVDWFKKTCS